MFRPDPAAAIMAGVVLLQAAKARKRTVAIEPETASEKKRREIAEWNAAIEAKRAPPQQKESP